MSAVARLPPGTARHGLTLRGGLRHVPVAMIPMATSMLNNLSRVVPARDVRGQRSTAEHTRTSWYTTQPTTNRMLTASGTNLTKH